MIKFHGVELSRNSFTLIMTRQKESRKARFRAALALAGLTQESWAEREGVTPGHLSQVLAGKRESRTLMEKIEGFTRVHLRSAA